MIKRFLLTIIFIICFTQSIFATTYTILNPQKDRVVAVCPDGTSIKQMSDIVEQDRKEHNNNPYYYYVQLDTGDVWTIGNQALPTESENVIKAPTTEEEPKSNVIYSSLYSSNSYENDPKQWGNTGIRYPYKLHYYYGEKPTPEVKGPADVIYSPGVTR